ncbi:MAG: ChbG/HpnK family deacetylase [Lachnospiraceae bacterium]|nr:ChbG/HpnK family deacetylase [Lachnospiraceae bacterium]
MIRAIINGDDFGISREVNEAISECFDRRILTGTTLMVNMRYSDDAVALARKYGFSDAVGLHLNLTKGYPLTHSIRSCKRFCKSNGAFNAVFAQKLTSRFILGPRERKAVREEIEAQLLKYIGYGFAERHIDSHHHVHTDSSIAAELFPLLHKYSFRSVRLSRNLYLKMGALKHLYKNIYNRGLRRRGFITTDYFGSYKDLAMMEGRIPENALVEVMLHPMYGENGEELMDTETPMSDVTMLLNSLKAERQAYFSSGPLA